MVKIRPMSRGRAHLRLSALLLGISIGVAVAPALAQADDESSSKEPAKKSMALVKVEIKLENGTVIKHRGQLLEWGEDSSVLLDGEGHSHAVLLTVNKQDKAGKKLSVKVGYNRDSSPVIAPFTYETAAKKREIIRSDDGLALAITVTPKSVAPDKKPKREDEIEGPKDPNDPLDGL